MYFENKKIKINVFVNQMGPIYFNPFNEIRNC